MKVTLFFISISCVYLLSLWRIYAYLKKKYISSINATETVVPEINSKIDIIAMPRNYVINIVQDEKEIDTSQFADMVVNISDYIMHKSESENPKEKVLKKAFLKDINFSHYKIIK